MEEKKKPVTEFFVIREDLCTTCGGTGIVQTSMWKQASEAGLQAQEDALAAGLSRRESGEKAVAAVMTTMARLGYDNPDHYPPEEVECAACEGTGIVRTEEPLRTALQIILAEFCF